MSDQGGHENRLAIPEAGLTGPKVHTDVSFSSQLETHTFAILQGLQNLREVAMMAAIGSLHTHQTFGRNPRLLFEVMEPTVHSHNRAARPCRAEFSVEDTFVSLTK